jgi:hypothetical protein
MLNRAVLNRCIQLLLSVVVLSGLVAQAQNPLLALLGNSAGGEERLLYKKPVGSYTFTVDGTRLVGDNYFKLDIREKGQPIPADSIVHVSVTPPERMGLTKSEFVARHDGEKFVVDPLPLLGTGEWTDQDTWLVTVAIQTSTGEATTDFGIQVYPTKPASSFTFRAVNVALPIAVLALFLAIFALGGVRLEQATT